MPADSLLINFFVTVIALMSAVIVFAGILLWRGRESSLGDRADSSIIFLFEGNMLVDSTLSGHALLHSADDGLASRTTDDLEKILRILSARFPDLRSRMAQMTDAVETVLGESGLDKLVIDHWEGFLRLTLHEHGQSLPLVGVGESSAMAEELRILRSIAEDSPHLIWRRDHTGRISWANRAYLSLAEALAPCGPDEDPAWPPAELFSGMISPDHDASPVRQILTLRQFETDTEDHFDVLSLRRGQESLHFATDANGMIRAEQMRRNFVQSFAKTFADLPTGLAIFDRHRKLVMFNPALVDLTGLPVTFLTAQPMIHAMLDRLRDLNMLPEPKNYSNWRDQMAALEAAAREGSYCENWTLPGGQTYRVTGRPHPDGAIAFLFEDITDEISLTRRFRHETDTAQAVFDTLEEAIAVFSPSGQLTICNAAYQRLWGQPSTRLGEPGIHDALRQWQSKSEQTQAWSQMQSQFEPFRDRQGWSNTVRLLDGNHLLCRMTPLPGGATLIGFRPTQPHQQVILDKLASDPVPSFTSARGGLLTARG